MKSKQELKQFFENGDKPNQEQFWELIESYFHKDETISLEDLSLLKSNLATIDKTNDGVETLGNVDTKEQVNAKINTAINALKANAPETYDTLKEIADYIANDTNAEAALLQLINAKLDKPVMTNNYLPKYNNGIFVNSIISEDNSTYSGSTKLTIGGNGDVRSKALVRFPSGSNLPYFNFGGTWMWETLQPFPTNLFAGDVFGVNGKLWLYGYNQQTVQGGLGYRKLVGLEYDDAGAFNTTWNFNTYGEDYQSKGFAQLLHTGSYYDNTILEQAPSSVGIDTRMRSGVLFNFTINAIKQQMYLDENGIYTRRLNYGDTTSNIWNKTISEKPNATTTLTEKLALARTKLKSYTKTERNALANKEVGELIWQTDAGNSGLRVYDGSNWLAIQTTMD